MIGMRIVTKIAQTPSQQKDKNSVCYRSTNVETLQVFS